ncbi:hypothetical protein UT300005_14850 [Clostridium sp. CTA-5]
MIEGNLIKGCSISGNSINEFLKGIDGSDIAIIMGVNKTKTPYDIYLDKINSNKEELNQKDGLVKSKEANYWDNTFKEIIAKEFSIRSGKKVRKENKKLKDEEYDFMVGSVDRKIVGENSILMCKTSNVNFPIEWNGGSIPVSYILQAQHYMRIFKADKCYVASLIEGKKFVYKEILRDDKLINMIIQIEKDFWFNNVLKNIPPKLS